MVLLHLQCNTQPVTTPSAMQDGNHAIACRQTTLTHAGSILERGSVVLGHCGGSPGPWQLAPSSPALPGPAGICAGSAAQSAQEGPKRPGSCFGSCTGHPAVSAASDSVLKCEPAALVTSMTRGDWWPGKCTSLLQKACTFSPRVTSSSTVIGCMSRQASVSDTVFICAG